MRTEAERKAARKISAAKSRAKPKAKAILAAWRVKNAARLKARDLAYQGIPENRARAVANFEGTPIEIPHRPRPDRCECCGEISTKTLHLDHCHSTGRFRGWCCYRCNTGAGIVDDIKRLRLRALYLERPFQSGPIKWAYPKGWKAQEAES